MRGKRNEPRFSNIVFFLLYPAVQGDFFGLLLA